MPICDISTLVPGMILEEDVITEKGSKLLPKGIRLNKRHINIMKAWGVAKVPVSDLSCLNTSRITTSSGPEHEKVRQELESIFMSHDANLVLREFNKFAARFGIGKGNETGLSGYPYEW
jgi:hypothetical protein